MSKYLVHYLPNGLPVGVWNDAHTNFYAEGQEKAKAYGEKVLGNANFSDFDKLLDIWDGKTPNGIARWGSIEDDTESLPQVLQHLEEDSDA